MSKKAWIIFAVICVVLLGGLVLLSSKDKIDVSNVDVKKIQTASVQSGDIADQVFGKSDSKVIFIEYGDFQCPGCGGAYPIVKSVTEKYQGQVAFVFRNFPLVTLHPNARAAAAAAEAAGLQGKYWDMHNKLYENQNAWENLSPSDRTDFFVGYAKALNLNTDTFKTDMANQKISFDQAVGKKAEVNATPTFFLDGGKLTDIYDDKGAVDEGKLDAAFATALKKYGVELPATTE